MNWVLTLALTAAVVAAAVAVARHARGFLRFRERVRDALAATPDIRWQRWTGRGLGVAVAGYPLELDLVPTYLHLRTYRRMRRGRTAAAHEPALLAELADVLRRRVPPGPIPPLPLVRDRVLPVLKAPGTLPPGHGYRPENILARRALDADVGVAYVIEGQFQVTYVTEGMLRAWELEAEALHALAEENLRARTRHLLDEIGGPRREYLALDGYDAARLLVADLLAPPDLADPVFAIPHEHACLLAPSDERAALRAAAEAAYRTSALPLTPALYRWTGTRPVRLD